MSFDTLLDHKCDIYHMEKAETSLGYDLPASPSFSYPTGPDVVAVSCHFGIKNSTVTIVQLEPQTNLEAKVKLTLPTGTDIRLNDKIVDCGTGYEYTAEIPRSIRDHHTTVELHRTDSQVAL